MFYAQEGDLIIRNLTKQDAETIARAEVAQGWIHATPDKHLERLSDAQNGLCITLVAEIKGEPAGYITLYHRAINGPFSGIPEIIDFNVLVKFRRRGIGSKLMDTVEALARKESTCISLGVGLHSGYGAAQRLYVLRGYVPDGSGVWYNNKVHGEYEPCVNDDDLVLYLSKKL